MSIWNLPVQDSEAVSEVAIKIIIDGAPFEMSEDIAARPISANCVGSIVTPLGIARSFSKPSERFHLVDRTAVEATAQRIRTAKAEQFKLMVDAENAFNQTFSKDQWPEEAPISGIQIKSIK